MDQIIDNYLSGKNKHLTIRILSNMDKIEKYMIDDSSVVKYDARLYETIEITDLNRGTKVLAYKNGVRMRDDGYYFIEEKSTRKNFHTDNLEWRLNEFTRKRYTLLPKFYNNTVVFKLRFSFSCSFNKKITFNMILIKRINKNKGSHINYLKFIKDKLFPKNLDESTFCLLFDSLKDVYDNTILEITFNNRYLHIINRSQLKKDIVSPVTYIHKTITHNDNSVEKYNIMLENIAAYINIKGTKLFHNKDLKQLGYPHTSLDIINIHNTIVSDKSNYYISSKITGGYRCVLYCTNKYLYLLKSGTYQRYAINNNKIIAENNKATVNDNSVIVDNETCICIIDSTVLPSDNDTKRKIFPFDVIYMNNINLASKSYSIRMEYIDDAINLLRSLTTDASITYIKKKIIPLNFIKSEADISDLSPSNIDVKGVILTRRSNIGYRRTLSWIWKPKSQLTINFLILTDSEYNGKILYSLNSPIFSITSTGNKTKYVRFTPRDNIWAWKYIVKIENSNVEIVQNLNNKIGEFYWTGKKWKLLKVLDSDNGQLPHTIMEAESIWQNRKNYVNMRILYNQEYLDNYKLPLSNSDMIQDIFHLYMQDTYANIAYILENNYTIDRNDLSLTADHLVRNSKVHIFAEKYVETYAVYEAHKSKLYRDNLLVHPSIYSMFKEKTFPEISVELLIVNVAYDKSHINNMKTLLLKIMRPRSRVIFINSAYAFEDLLSLAKKCKFVLEINSEELVSFVRF